MSEGCPQLSVVIACWNVQDVLGIQLAALARQRSPVPWEVIVADNGSTDGTVALARSWADRLPLRIVEAAATRGSGPARNAGAEAALGQWLAFCDADDEVGDGWLVALCAALREHPFVAGRFEGERLNSPRTLRSRRLDQQDGLQRASAAVGLPHAGAGNLGIRRSVFFEVGGFDPTVRYLQDTELCWRVQRAGWPLVFVPDLVVHVRLRATLRTMYRQGRNYGASQAMLERRYAGSHRLRIEASRAEASRAEASRIEASRIEASRAGSTRTRGARALRSGVRLARLVRRNGASIGAQAWQLGWHIGWRRGFARPG